jgi:hypothetical protein
MQTPLPETVDQKKQHKDVSSRANVKMAFLTMFVGGGGGNFFFFFCGGGGARINGWKKLII